MSVSAPTWCATQYVSQCAVSPSIRMFGGPMKCIVASKWGSTSHTQLGEFGARAAEGVVVVETVRVVAGGHRRLVEPVGAAGEALDDVGDLFAGEQFFDGQTHDRQPRSPVNRPMQPGGRGPPHHCDHEPG